MINKIFLKGTKSLTFKGERETLRSRLDKKRAMLGEAGVLSSKEKVKIYRLLKEAGIKDLKEGYEAVKLGSADINDVALTSGENLKKAYQEGKAILATRAKEEALKIQEQANTLRYSLEAQAQERSSQVLKDAEYSVKVSARLVLWCVYAVGAFFLEKNILDALKIDAKNKINTSV